MIMNMYLLEKVRTNRKEPTADIGGAKHVLQLKKKRLSSIKQEWEMLEKQRKCLSPFNTYSFALCLYKGYRFLFGMKGIPEFYLIFDNNVLLMICPVVRNRVEGEITYSSFGSRMSVVDEDFIYPDCISDETLYECLCLLTEKIGAVSFERVSEGSRIYSIGVQNGMICNEGKTVNALITLPKTYDEYYNRLSKKMRATIRGARNRLSSDGLTDEVQIYFGNMMPRHDYIRASRLYANSKNERYSIEQNRIKRNLHWVYRVFFHHHAQALNKVASSVCAVYRIDGVPVAMLQGYLDVPKKRICWHRAGFDSRYDRYSPGVMLYQKTIKKHIDDTDIKLFDLSIGGEEYKFRLGAEAYYDRSFDLIPINEKF